MTFPIAFVALNQLDMIIKQVNKLRNKRSNEFCKELLNLKGNLEKIEGEFIQKAGQPGHKEELEIAAYKIDNAVGEWSSALVKLEIKEADTTKKKKASCPVSSMPCLSHSVVRQNDIDKTKKLNSDLKKLIDTYEIQSSIPVFSSLTPVDQKNKSDSYNSSFIGRGEDIETIKNKLLKTPREHSLPTQSQHECFYYIIGAGGVGKTALASKVVHDWNVKNHFGSKLWWVSVSQPSDEVELAKAILKEIEGVPSALSELELLVERIYSFINTEKFLLVLDGVTENNYQRRGKLEKCLNSGAAGSRVLVTTHYTLATDVESFYSHCLESLSGEDRTTLFSTIALYGRDQEECTKLQAMASELSSFCTGLPLAVQTLGYFMRQKRENDWNDELKEKIQKSIKDQDICHGLLSLCYNDLPIAFRHCFSYCVVFPRHERIEQATVVKLWMAQGFLSNAENLLRALGCRPDTKMESLGDIIFNHLAKRSFFQQFRMNQYDDGIKSCKMHHLVHDFAQSLAGEDFFVKVTHAELLNQEEDKEAQGTEGREGELQGVQDKDVSRVRTLLICNLIMPQDYNSHLVKKFQKYTSIRELSLTNSLVSEIPHEIGELMQLRYLNLSKNKHLKILPSSLCNLCHLQTLNINWCFDLDVLPKEMERLIKLRHLENEGTYKLKFLPKGIEKLKDIQTLTRFPVSNKNEKVACQLEDLKELHNLGGYISIIGLGNLKSSGEAKKAKLNEKVQLRKLVLDFYREKKQSIPIKEEEVIDALEPHTGLTQMVVIGYRGKTVSSSWIKSVKGLRRLELKKWNGIKSLPPLGELPNLTFLHIEGMKYVSKVGVEFFGLLDSETCGFPKLQSLTFSGMRGLQNWEIFSVGEEVSIMPELRCLTFQTCPKLMEPPPFILNKHKSCRNLKELIIQECPNLNVNLSDLKDKLSVKINYQVGTEFSILSTFSSQRYINILGFFILLWSMLRSWFRRLQSILRSWFRRLQSILRSRFRLLQFSHRNPRLGAEIPETDDDEMPPLEPAGNI